MQYAHLFTALIVLTLATPRARLRAAKSRLTFFATVWGVAKSMYTSENTRMRHK